MIDPKVVAFLRAIKKNNTKAWYDAHKEEYKQHRNNFRVLLEGVRDGVALFDPVIADAHKRGVETIKIFRIHRDARFSRGKTKYKTSMSGLISADIKNPREPVYYFSVEPGNKSFVGGGVRSPESKHLDAIRAYLDVHYKKLERILADVSLCRCFPSGLSQEFKLKRAPQGYDIEHPGIELLRYKNFTIGAEVSDRELKEKELEERLVKQLSALCDFNVFLRQAGGAS